MTEADIRRAAEEVGFDACGVATARRLDADAEVMDRWVGQGLHGNMDYLERNREKRYDPRELVEGGKTVVVCLLTYTHSGHDYHRAVKSKLYQLEALLRERYGDEIVGAGQHIFCDSAPFLERRWAVLAGLGQIGRNHQLIHPELGSMVHPGELVLQCEVECATPSEQKDICGDCHRCEEACPTGALRQQVWDARLCVAYKTHHCLVCQQACPYNKQHINKITSASR